MSHAHHSKPIIPRAFPKSNAASNPRRKNLSPTARNRRQSGGFESPDDLPHIHLKKPLELHKLRRAERMNMHRREIRLDVSQQVFIPLDRQRIVHAALHQNLRPADGDQFRNFLTDLGVVERIAVRIFMVTAERAEGAMSRADIRVINVSIDHIRAVILRVHPLAGRVGPLAKIVHRSIVIKLHRLLIHQASVASNHRINIERQRFGSTAHRKSSLWRSTAHEKRTTRKSCVFNRFEIGGLKSSRIIRHR